MTFSRSRIARCAFGNFIALSLPFAGFGYLFHLEILLLTLV